MINLVFRQHSENDSSIKTTHYRGRVTLMMLLYMRAQLASIHSDPNPIRHLYASPGDMLTCISGCWRRGFTGDKCGLQYGYICSVISKHTHKPWWYLFKGNLSVYSVGIAYPRLAFIDIGTGIGKMVGGYKYDFSCKHGGNNDIFRSRCAVRSETDRKQGIFENHSLYIRYQSINANRVPQVRQSRFVWYTSEIQLGWRIRPCQ